MSSMLVHAQSAEAVHVGCERLLPSLHALAEENPDPRTMQRQLDAAFTWLKYLEQQHAMPAAPSAGGGTPNMPNLFRLMAANANYTVPSIKALVQQHKVPYHLSKAVAVLWRRAAQELLDMAEGRIPVHGESTPTFDAFHQLMHKLQTLLCNIGMSVHSLGAVGDIDASSPEFGGPAVKQQLLDSGLLEVLYEQMTAATQQLRRQAQASQQPASSSTSSTSGRGGSRSKTGSSRGTSTIQQLHEVPHCVRSGIHCMVMLDGARRAYPGMSWHTQEVDGPSIAELTCDLCMAAFQHVGAHLEQLSTPAQEPASPYFTLIDKVFQSLTPACFLGPFNHMEGTGGVPDGWTKSLVQSSAFQAVSVFISALVAANRLMPPAASSSSPWQPMGDDYMERRAADWRATLKQQQQGRPILPAQLLQSVQEVTGVSPKGLAFFALHFRSVYGPTEACVSDTSAKLSSLAHQVQRMIALCTAKEHSSLWQQLASGAAADSPQLHKQVLPLLLLCLDKTKGAASVSASTSGSSTASAAAGGESSAGGSVWVPGVPTVLALMEEHIRWVGRALQAPEDYGMHIVAAAAACRSILPGVQALASAGAPDSKGAAATTAHGLAAAEMWGLLVSGLKLQQVLEVLMKQNGVLPWLVEYGGAQTAATADVAVGALRILSCSSSTTSNASSTGGVAAAGSVLAAGSGGRVLDEAHPWLMLLGRSCHQLAGTLNLDLARATASGQDLERAVRLLQVLHQAMGASVSGISAVLLDSLQLHKQLADGLSKIGCSGEHLLQLAQELQAVSQAVDAALTTGGAGPALAAAAAAATSSTNSSTSSASTANSSSHGAASTSSPGECARVAQACQAAMQVTDADAIATIASQCGGFTCDCMSCQAGTAVIILHHSPLKSSLINALESVGSALSRIPGPGCCNNPSCTNMASSSEQQLAGGRQTLCSGCKTVRYCCRACQKAHWKQHKVVCKALAARAAAAAGPAQG